jgi:hypothetical protein
VAQAFRRGLGELERNALCARVQEVVEAGTGKRVFDEDFEGSFERGLTRILTLALALSLTLALAPALGGETQRVDGLPEKYSKHRRDCHEQTSRAMP